MNIQESIKILPQGEIAILEFDLVGEKVNKLSSSVMAQFKEILEDLKKSSYKIVIITSKKPQIFIAGADIEEIKAITAKEQFEMLVQEGQSIFNLLEDLPQITMAAVNGACAGGGCELILACDYRIASDDSATRIGLPETRLGIIPGLGGCIRLPRTVGLKAALDVILPGKLLSAKKALQIGLVDRVVNQDHLVDECLLWARALLKEKTGKRKLEFKPKGLLDIFSESALGRKIIFSKAHDGIIKAAHGHYPAPLKALDAIKKSYGMSDRDYALKIERENFCEVAITEVSKNLIHVFYLTESVKKQTGVADTAIKPLEITSLGIIGAGTMGNEIAYVAADKGITVTIKDLSPEISKKGLKHAQYLWQKLVKRKIISQGQFEQKKDLISISPDYSGFANLDVVIESVDEDIGLKQKVIAEAATQMRPDVIMATTTDTLEVSDLSRAHPKPEYFAGMHFFHPVSQKLLVEVVRGEKTSDTTISTLFELSKKLGKTPVVIKDSPGFLVNRLLFPYMTEALFLLQEGMSIDKIDKAYVNEFGMFIGPFALMDEIGLDNYCRILKTIKQAFGERIETFPIIYKLITSGRSGRKNYKGFYKYDSKRNRLKVDHSVYRDLELATPWNPYEAKECVERGIFSMINESSIALLENHIVETPTEIDLALILGAGFPPFRGGLLKYADSLGLGYIVDQLDTYSLQRKALRLKPAASLRSMAERLEKFYM